MIVFVALIMIVLIGFLGLAVDVGHLYMVKSQLQNAADAGALAGAAAFNTALDPTNEALRLVRTNKSESLYLLDANVSCLDASNIGPSCAASSLPVKIKVVVERTAGKNGGAVPLYFARAIFTNGTSTSIPVKASAMAELKPGPSPKPRLIKVQ